MGNNSENNRSRRIRKYFVIAGLGWAFVILFILYWGVNQEQKHSHLLALREARLHLFEDHALSLWVNSHGRMDDTGDSKPILSAQAIAGEKSSKKLFARNSRMSKEATHSPGGSLLAFYPNVQAHRLQIKHSIFKEGEILTGWQQRAINAFKEDNTEFHEFSQEKQNPTLHLSTAIMANDTCMIQCHQQLPATFREKITALGVSIPLAGLQALKHEVLKRLLFSLAVIWLLGLGVLVFVGKRVKTHVLETEKLNTALNEERAKTLYSKAQFEAIFNSITDGVVFTDLQRQIQMVNPGFTKLLGYSFDEIVGQKTDVYYSNYAEFVSKGLERFNVEAVIEEPVYEIEYRRKDGSIFMSETLGTKVYDQSGEVIGFLAVIRDITDRHQFQRETERSRKRLEAMLTLNEMRDEEKEKIILYGLDQCVNLTGSKAGYFYTLEDNPKENRLVTWSECADGRWTLENVNTVCKEGENFWMDCVSTRTPVIHNSYQDNPGDNEISEEQGNFTRKMSIPLIDRDQVVAVIGLENKKDPYTGFDVQEVSILAQALLRLLMRQNSIANKKILEIRLQQASKMEAIGTLAGGIAHDFNNILGIIHGNADMVLDDLSPKSPSRRNIHRILQAALRAKDIIKKIMLYSRQSDVMLNSFNPCDLVKETIELLRATVPSTVKIEPFISGDSIKITADKVQFQQVMINLFSNAVDAMEEKGTITVIGERVDLQLTDFIDRRGARPGTYFRLIIADTGIGMDDKIVERIFDPFFTTKAVSEGTGMGLSTVKGIVDSHNGIIRVDSTPGSGATFHVLFPISKTEEFEESLHVEPDEIIGNGERILFVDDEEMYAEMGEVMLTRLGYKAKSMTSSKLALEAFRSYPGAFDLVITDQTMPDLSGIEFATELLKISPDLPIILCTGFSTKVNKQTAMNVGIREFLLKPLDKKILSQAIYRAFKNTPAVERIYS